MARTRHFLASVVASALVVAGLSHPVLAGEIDQATKDSLKSIITQQIDAFSRNDAATAESFAAPGIKMRWPDPKDFVAMVRQSYAPLFQPRSTHFDDTGSNALGPMQKVTIVDHDGTAWTAVYTFEQVDGQWRINGCALVKEQSTNV